MIDVFIHTDLLIILRAVLFLGPLILTLILGFKYVSQKRYLVGGLFSFLYSLGLLLPAHGLAVHLGLWSYGGEALMVLGMPADLWFGGSLLFGPAIFFAFPKLNPLIFTLAFILLQALVFQSLDPFVTAGNGWFIGVILVFVVVHIPALYLARWTAYDTQLCARSCLLAFGYGFLAFFVLPTIIMQAMGGTWSFAEKSLTAYLLTIFTLMPLMIIGLTAVHMFVIHGRGTPIPLDKTKFLVRSGIYAYITNPMQLCSALSWIVIGVFLENIFVSLAAFMAVIFVLGMVRWHHRNDLLQRFPEGWPEYKANVPEWLPRWKPWVKEPSVFFFDPQSARHRAYKGLLTKLNCIGLVFEPSADAVPKYIDANRGLEISGFKALCYPLFHCNFLITIFASGLLLLTIPRSIMDSRTR